MYLLTCFSLNRPEHWRNVLQFNLLDYFGAEIYAEQVKKNHLLIFK